jgi:hypothetical protein
MATLHETALPNVIPLHVLQLSTSPEPGKSSFPRKLKPPPLSLKSVERHPLHDLSAQDIFTMFRPAGAIRMVRTNVNVRYSHPVSVLEYNESESVTLARNILHSTLLAKAWPDCKLQAHEPANLYVSVSELSSIMEPAVNQGVLQNIHPLVNGTELGNHFKEVSNSSPSACALLLKRFSMVTL